MTGALHNLDFIGLIIQGRPLVSVILSHQYYRFFTLQRPWLLFSCQLLFFTDFADPDSFSLLSRFPNNLKKPIDTILFPRAELQKWLVRVNEK